MCDMLITHEGAELVNVDELRRYGISVEGHGVDGHPFEGHDCLCVLELDAVVAAHSSEWRRVPADGYAEVGPDGRTWEDGFDANREDGCVIILGRSDGRSEKTLEEIEAERSA